MYYSIELLHHTILLTDLNLINQEKLHYYDQSVVITPILSDFIFFSYSLTDLRIEAVNSTSGFLKLRYSNAFKAPQRNLHKF